MQKPRDTESYVNNELDTPVPAEAPLSTDEMETLQPGTRNVIDSASSEADAGLIDPTRDDEDTLLDSEFDEAPPAPEIVMSDLDTPEPQLHSPVMNDMDAPGEVNIEELDEDAVRDLLPADARLDPLED